MSRPLVPAHEARRRRDAAVVAGFVLAAVAFIAAALALAWWAR